jgi:hypothetical protein
MLSEEEKKKIEEEEKLRAEIKNKYSQPPKKKTTRATWLGLILIGIVVIIMVVAYNQPSASKAPAAPTPHLQARVSTTADYLNIYNDSQDKWTGCKVRLNTDYKATVVVAPGKNSFSYDDITKDGQRFNYYTTKPTSFYMTCQSPAMDYSADW